MSNPADNQLSRRTLTNVEFPTQLSDLRGFYRLAESGAGNELVVYVLGDTEYSRGD